MIGKRAFLKRQLLPIFIGFYCLFTFTGAFAQQGHTYPRVGAFYWGGGPAEYFARFDLVILTIYEKDQLVYDIKSLNPETVVMPTIDWNAAAQRSDIFPDEFKLTLANGRKWGWYGAGIYPESNKVAPNVSDVSPMVDGKQGWEFFAEVIAGLKNLDIWDGCATDGFYAGLHMEYHIPPGVDLDRNGVPDEDEHGKSWIVSHWNAGCSKLLFKLRELIGPDEPILINSGQWFNGHASISPVNGFLGEYWGYTNNWKGWEKVKYEEFMQKETKPSVSIVQSNPSPRDPFRTDVLKDYFRLVRFGLTRTMMGNGYFGYEDLHDAYHYYSYFYDEYELDVGYPTTDMMELDGKDVWVRFFDDGVAISNISKYTHTITDADLQGLPGYNGPYYKFEGGQVPEHNDGSLFQSVTLEGDNFTEYDGNVWIVGDGIIMTKTPKIHVTDIIVDNVHVGTTPGSGDPVYTGLWEDVYANNDCYTLRIAQWIEERKLCGYAVAQGGTDATVVFTPTIGVPGTYAVYEWHGHDDGNESGSVQYTVESGALSTPYFINQKVNQGQWNLLGNFYFAKGTNGRVTVSAQNAHGNVIADAIKFEFKGKSAPDNVPPNSPVSLRADGVTENSVSLRWDAPGTASDGDAAFLYQVYRDGQIINTTANTVFTDVDLLENTSYSYSVYSVDDAGNRSASATTRSISTTADMTAPAIVRATGIDVENVDILFSEPVTAASAENTSNYEMSNGLSVRTAVLMEDQRTVRISTSAQVVDVYYTVYVSNIRDVASNQNIISANSSAIFTADAGNFNIAISADDSYQLYVNGVLIGSGSEWNISQLYEAPAVAGKNVIAIHCADIEGLAGMLTKIEFGEMVIISDDSWKVTTTLEDGWESIDFDDLHWQKTTSLGAHGFAKPWSDYGNVRGIPTDEGVQWIWSSDNENDNSVYFRYTVRIGGDSVPPSPPSGLRKK